MQRPNDVDRAILYLRQKDVWRLSELPDWIANVSMLRELDRAEEQGKEPYVEVRLWWWVDPTSCRDTAPKPRQPQMKFDIWISPSRAPRGFYQGGWERVIATNEADVECSHEIRLTETGKYAKLEGAGLTAATSAEGGLIEKRRGRPVDTDPKEDEQLYDSWKSGMYKTYADCARANGKKVKPFKLAIDRHEKRLAEKTCQ